VVATFGWLLLGLFGVLEVWLGECFFLLLSSRGGGGALPFGQ